jgi:hypothetical protein
MALLESLIVFVVSLLIGGLGIYVGGRVLTDTDSYEHAVVTALIGSFVWAVVGFVLGWVPLLGPLFVLVAYIAVVNWRYPGGWTTAVGIALVAWVTSVVVLYVLALLNLVAFEAVGVPGA